jgi:hypothetical protein
LVVNTAHNLEKAVKADGIIVPKQSADFTCNASRVEAVKGLK